jgi:hypothetical protein
VGHRLAVVLSLLATVLSSFALQAVAASAAAQDCVVDDALTRAAAELLLDGEAPTAESLLDASRRAGSDAPLVRGFLGGEGDAAGRASFLRRGRAELDAALACGEARSEGRSLLLVAPRGGHLVLADEGLRVELEPGWREPIVHVRDAHGELWQATVAHGDTVRVPADLDPPLDVQLVARGPRGPRPVAERALGEPSATPIDPAVDGAPIDRVALLRADAGARELRPNRLLEQVASRYAEEVCAAGRVTHIGSDGDPEERLARAGVRARHVGETVARAEDVTAAIAATLRSPSHRAALSDRRFTDVGLSTATDAAGRTCLVVLLAAWPRAVPFASFER